MEAVEFCTREEFETIYKAAKSIKHKAMILLLNDAGLRVSEMRNLSWNNFDFRTRTIKVKSLKKRGQDKSRLIPVSDRLYEVLAALIEKHPPKAKDSLLFESPSRPGKPVGRSSVNNMFYKIKAERPEVGRIYPHKLRHTFATNLRAHNADLADVRDLLGHSSLNTTLIYAHANQDKLRAAINATKPKPTLTQRLKDMLFKRQAKRINWTSFDSSMLVGREAEARQITDLVNKGISVLITGKVGTGKTQLLDSLKFSKPILEIDDCKEWRKSLANMLLYLFEGDKENVLPMFYPDTDKSQVRAKMSKESIISMSKVLCSVCEKGEYILKLNDIDQVTPSVVKSLEVLKEHFTIVCTSRGLKATSSTFVWSFEKVELGNLTRSNTLRLTQHLCAGLEVENIEHLRNKVWDVSEGNPRMIQELCDRFRKEPMLDTDTVADICANYIGKQTTEIDMSIYLLLMFGGLAILRYLSAEMGNPSLRFIGGCFMIFLMFGRYFFNSTRRKMI